MLSQERMKSLETKKDMLARKIEEQEKSPSIDQTTLRHLKRQKLEIKEIIEGIRHDSGTLH